MRKPDFHFPTLLGILIASVGLVTGVVLLKNPLSSLVGATPEEAPKKVKMTNITDQEFVVTWVTDKALTGFVQYGESSNPDLVVSDDRDQSSGSVGSYFTHFVTIKNLQSSTKYNFRIGSGKSLYDQQGELYQISTGPQLSDAPAADVAYGQVNTTSGDAAAGALVYIHLSGMIPQAALVKPTGSWVIPLATSRTTDLTSFAPYDKITDKLEIFVEGGILGTSQLTVTTAEDKPVSLITLGTNQIISVEPTIDPNLPSKFVGAAIAAPATETAKLTILIPKSNESVNSTQPEIVGKAPAKATIEIEIHSNEIITDTTVADANGDWSYSIPAGLSPGEHTITISTLVNGVIKKVTRSFVVQAANESNAPAFSATASATLAPTTQPTPSPTKKLTPTSTVAPTIAPRVSYPSTESGVPNSGNLTPTILLAILGIGLISAGIISYKIKFT